ncbi:MAG: hypothetical protein IJC09_08275 [Clostridia bacterium]|nr:hypothetical protein [Clostridia bacterium]
MKKLYQKIIVSILSLTVMGTVCAIAPVMAEADEATVAQMIFESVSFGSSLTEPTDTIVRTKTGDAKFATYSFNNGTDNYGLTGGVTVGVYYLGGANDYIIVELPQKEGYDLTAAEVTVGQYKASTNIGIADYSYSTESDGTYNPVNHAYISGAMEKVSGNYNLFVDVVKLPADAKYLKITRNATTTSAYSDRAGVTGFTFGYAPQNADKIQFSETSEGKDLMKLLASGILPASGELSIQATRSDRVNADGAYGLSISGTETQTFNAIDGYKITEVSMNAYNSSADFTPFVLTLGDAADEINDKGEGSLKVVSESGETSFTLASEYGTGVAYDVVITMEKKLETSIDSAVDNGTAVTATATVSNLGLAEYDSMELIVAGYDGDRFTGAQTKTVTKADADGTDSLTATLPTGTKSVKVFLWKDLDTLESILAPIELAVTTASAE